jgi:hypothetical protein
MAAPAPAPSGARAFGSWARQVGKVYSDACTCCQSTDTHEAALRRQHAAAVAGAGVASTRRRVVTTWSGDMKGLMQLLGHAGPNATYFCMFCLAKLNETNKAGVPHLRVLPEEWRLKDKRATEIIDPPAREGTMEMSELAEAYNKAKAAQAPKGLSSAAWYSCQEKPLVFAMQIIMAFSGTPLHITLGLGTNHLKLVESEATELDEDIALYGQDAVLLAAYKAAEKQRAAAREKEEQHKAEAESTRAGMAICVAREPSAGAGGKAAAGSIKEQFRAYKKQAEAAESTAKEHAKQAVAAEKKVAAVKEKMAASEGQGPFMQRFCALLKALKIDVKKYFGGTYIGPDLNKILHDDENIKQLAAVRMPFFGHAHGAATVCCCTRAEAELCRRVAGGQVLKALDFKCADGETRSFGSDTRAAEVEACLLPLGACHRIYNRKEPACEHEISSFSQHVDAYAIGFARAYPKVQPTPKMHVLCYHHDEILKLKGSIGMDTEQGIECLHPEINYIKSHFRALDRQPEAQLAAIAEQAMARGRGKRARDADAKPLRASKHARAEKARAVHKCPSLKKKK